MDTSRVRWRKSSFSGGNNGECVELANDGNASLVRDSKNLSGPYLRVTLGGLLAAVKDGRLR